MTNKFFEKEFVLIAIAAVSGLIALSTLLWVLTTYPIENKNKLGERFVVDEISILGLTHFKPITIIVIFTLLFFISILETFRSYFARLPKMLISVIFVISVLSTFVFFYEFLWNFVAWFSVHISDEGKTHVDSLYYLPSQINQDVPGAVNFVLQTKKFFLYFAISLYLVYFSQGFLRRDSEFKYKSNK